LSKYLTILFFFSHSFFINAQPIVIQNNDTLLSTMYFNRHQIRTISFVCMLQTSWKKSNPAFDTSINARIFRLNYNADGYCTQMSWFFCHWDSAKQQLDTSISSIENFFYFKYHDSDIVNLDIFSFSIINNVRFLYQPNMIIRHTSIIEQNNNVVIKPDTVCRRENFISIKNPFDFAIYPDVEILKISSESENNFLLNQIPFTYFDEALKGRKVLVKLCPIMAVWIDTEN